MPISTFVSPPRNTVTGLSAEAELLLVVLSSDSPEKLPDRAAALMAEDGFDWDRFGNFIQNARVLPQLHQFIDATKLDFPSALVRDLEMWSRQWTLRALAQNQVLANLLATLHERSIEVLFYKGPGLTDRLYGGLTNRHYRDIDFLVRREKVVEAKEILVGLGFEPVQSLDSLAESRHFDRDCEYEMLHPKTGQLIELHWNILEKSTLQGFDIDALWQHSREATLHGQPIRELDSEWLFLVLAIHGGEKHRWARLKWLQDVAKLISSEPVDWSRLRQLAQSCGRVAVVEQASLLCASFLQAPVPAEVLKSAATRSNLAACAVLRARVFDGPDASVPGYSDWKPCFEFDVSFWEQQAVVKSSCHRASRFAWLLAILTPGWTERRRFRLPAALGFLHWIFRPLLLAWNVIKSLFGSK